MIMEALPDFEEPTLVLLAALVDGNRPLAAALPPSLPLMLVEKHLAARGALRRARRRQPRPRRLAPPPPPRPRRSRRRAAHAVQEIVLHALLTPRPGEPPLDGALAIEPETPAYVQRQEATAPNARGEAARVGQWQLQTLALLAACAHGPSQLAEARLHALYPLRHLLSALLDTATPRPLSAALLPLLQHAHIESQLRPLSLGDHPLLGRLLAAVAASIDRVSWKLPLKSLRAAHGTLHYELAAAVPFVLSLVDGGADGSRPARRRRRRARGHGDGRAGKGIRVGGAAVPAARRPPPPPPAGRPRVAQRELSTPRRSPLAVRAPPPTAAAAPAAPAAAMRSLLAASPESRTSGPLFSRPSKSPATPTRRCRWSRFVRRSCASWAISRRRPRVSRLCVDALRLLLGVLNAQEGGAKAALRRRLERGGDRYRFVSSLPPRRRRRSSSPPPISRAPSSPLTPTPKAAAAARRGTRRRRACSRVPRRRSVPSSNRFTNGSRPSLRRCGSKLSRNPCSPQARGATAAAMSAGGPGGGGGGGGGDGDAPPRMRAVRRRRRRARRAVARPPFPAGAAPPAALRRYELLDSARRPRAAPAAAAAAAPRPAARRPRRPRQTRARRPPLARPRPQRRHPSAALASRPPIGMHRDTRCCR